MKKLISLIIAIVMIASVLCSLSVSAATASAKFIAPDAVYEKDELKLSIAVSGDNIKGVTGTVTYDYSILEFSEATVDAKGWKINVNPVEDQLFFSAVDAQNDNPVNGTAIFTINFSTEYSLKGDKIEITGSEIKASSGNGTVSLGDISYENTVTVKPAVQEPQGNTSTPSDSKTEDSVSDKTDSKDDSSESDNEEDDSEDENYFTSDEDYDEEAEGTEKGDPLDDIRLKSLEIENVEVDLGFEPDTKSYNINIPNDIKELVIKAEPMNPDSTVTIIDNKLTYPVKNITKIVVEAENGSKRTYKIYSMKDMENQGANGAEGGLAVWHWIAIIGGSLLLAAAVFIIVLLILKRKKNK